MTVPDDGAPAAQDSRRYPRMRVSAPFACAFARIGPQRWLSSERGGLGVVLDLSLRGAKVMTAASMRPGEHVAVSLRLPRQLAVTHVDATVRWERDHTVGLEFASLSQYAESRLKRFISYSVPCA